MQILLVWLSNNSKKYDISFQNKKNTIRIKYNDINYFIHYDESKNEFCSLVKIVNSNEEFLLDHSSIKKEIHNLMQEVKNNNYNLI